MLAKVWKKLLLAICIIAVLFNITAKLVNRISLERAISSAPEGVNLKEVLNIPEENTKTVTSSNYSKNVVEDEVTEYTEPQEETILEDEELEEEQNNYYVEEEEKPSIIDQVTESIKGRSDVSTLLTY